MHSSSLKNRSIWTNTALIVALVMLWLLLCGYHGLTGDGQIYAFQALARLHPQLSTDLYLQYTSQDRYTLFSPFYAWCIRLLGLESAARLLTLLFTFWLLAATWRLARALAGRDAAWAAVAFLVIAGGQYGGSGVFRILDPFLTARLPAEAMIATALACQASGMRRLGVALALAAMLIHPLIALPGLLMIACLWLPFRVCVIGSIGGLFACLAICAAAAELPAISNIVPIMDPAWLDVVRERSQFLFLQLWSTHDWNTNALPFISLGLAAMSAADRRIRRFCAAAALVGMAGLAVAAIGGLLGPVAIVVQGQAWRWVWITVLVSAVLVPITAMRVGLDERCGSLCALLLVAGWTLPGIDGSVLAALASILWLARPHIKSDAAKFFRWASAALALGLGIWILLKCEAIVSAKVHPARAPWDLLQIQHVFALQFPAVLLCALIWSILRTARTDWVPALLSAMMTTFSAIIFSTAFSQPRTLASSADIQEFRDWANAIPPTSTVLVTPARDVGAFVWFTLDRPNYLTLDQSAGVVFSRSTALEVRRRSEVLLPLRDPDWKILTRLRSRTDRGRASQRTTRPLTSKSLIQVCADSQLGFVISPEKLGFDPVPHNQPGGWKDWNLYDCRKVRSRTPS